MSAREMYDTARVGAAAEINATYFRTKGGLLAARLEQTSYLAVPADGETLIAYAIGLDIAPERWTPGDFYGRGGLVAGEDGFRSYVEEQASHRRQLSRLARPSIKSGAHTPWGCAQQTQLYSEGIVSHSTAEHGGFHLAPHRNAVVNPAWRNDDGWYEEDCQWAKVAMTFPELFTAFERKCAHDTLRNSEPDAYELITGVVLLPGESCLKDGRQFKRDHAVDWIVVAAINSSHRPGFVECVAKLGGERRSREERRFLIPKTEYEIGRFGFVIDPARHARYDGTSDFIGWRDKASTN